MWKTSAYASEGILNNPFEDAVRSANFDVIIKAVKTVCGYDKEKNSYSTQSLALMLGRSQQKVSDGTSVCTNKMNPAFEGCCGWKFSINGAQSHVNDLAQSARIG